MLCDIFLCNRIILFPAQNKIYTKHLTYFVCCELLPLANCCYNGISQTWRRKRRVRPLSHKPCCSHVHMMLSSTVIYRKWNLSGAFERNDVFILWKNALLSWYPFQKRAVLYVQNCEGRKPFLAHYSTRRKILCRVPSTKASHIVYHVAFCTQC